MATITAAVSMATAAQTKGVMPPLLRAYGHLAFCAAQAQAEAELKDLNVPNDDYVAEIDHAMAQWNLVFRDTYVNEDIITKAKAITDHWKVLKTSVTGDTRDNFRRNLMTMIKEITSLAVLIDMAVFGLKYPDETDAGKEL